MSNRYIKFFPRDDDLDITIIQLKDSDNIIEYVDFLDYDLNYIRGYDQYLNNEIFTIEHPKNEPEHASGKIIEIFNNFEFKHSIDTEGGASGSPLILINTLKVIGIHKAGHIDENNLINFGTFIGEIFKDIYRKYDNNYIIGTFLINKNNIGRDIQIINSYDEYHRHRTYYDIEEEIKDCIIEINNIKLASFSYYHKFDEEGIYTIKYTFNNILINCNYMFFHCKNLINLDLSNLDTKMLKI